MAEEIDVSFVMTVYNKEFYLEIIIVPVPDDREDHHRQHGHAGKRDHD